MRVQWGGVVLLVVLLLCGGCGGVQDKHAGKVLASVGKRTLNEEDIPYDLLHGHTGADSLAVLRGYVEQWARREVLYQEAMRRMGGKSIGIERQIEDYARTLYINEYEKSYEQRHLDTSVSRPLADSFYRAHTELFKLSTPLIRCLVLVVAADNPNLEALRKAYRTCDSEGLQELASLTLKAGVTPRCTPDDWLALPDLLAMLPASLERVENSRRMRNIEVEDNGVVYLANICEWLDQGSIAPFSYVYPHVRGIILNQRRVEQLRLLEQTTYEAALSKGQVKLEL